jgi:hypothetical protein
MRRRRLRPVPRFDALDLRGEVLHARRREDLHLRLGGRDLDLDLLVVELAFAQLLAELLPRGVILAGRVLEAHAARARQQRVEDPFFGSLLRPGAHAAHRLLAGLLDADLDEIAHDGVDVAPDVADLGELGGLDLDERRIREAREAARDLGLAHAGRPDHQDVLRRDLLAQRLGDLLAPPAVPERDRDRALRPALADDVLVQLVHDLLGSHAAHRCRVVSFQGIVSRKNHSRTSMERWWFV